MWNEVVAACVVVGLVAVLVGFLWLCIRAGIIARRRTSGWESRLAQPNLEEVESLCQVRLPFQLEELYRKEGTVRRFGFYLLQPGEKKSKHWFIAHFVPLTARDVSEWMKATAVPGIPIAVDGSKGTYYLPFEALRRGDPIPVLFREPGLWSPKDSEVATSIDEFIRFQAVDELEEHGDNAPLEGNQHNP